MIGFPQLTLKKVMAIGYDNVAFIVDPSEKSKLVNNIEEKLIQLNIPINQNFVNSIAMSLLKETHSDRHNPYVEHGAPHALRVGDNMVKLYDFLKNHQVDVLKDIANKVGMSHEDPTIPFLFWISGILHDCNYFIDCAKGEIKTIHALKSALVAYEILNYHFQLIFSDNKENLEKIITFISDAILCHNGDSHNHKFSQLLHSPIGDIPYEDLSTLKGVINNCIQANTAHAFIGACSTHMKSLDGRKCHNSALVGIPFKEANLKTTRFFLWSG